MTDFSAVFPVDSSRIKLPSDLEASAERLHQSLDSDRDGFLSSEEIASSSVASQSGTESKLHYLLTNAGDRLSKLSPDRTWIGVQRGGVSLSDLKSIKQLDDNKQLVRQGLLADLEFVFGAEDIRNPVATARMLTDGTRIDTNGDGSISQSEVDLALRSPDRAVSAVGNMLNVHFDNIASLDEGNTGRITERDLVKFRYLLDPSGGLVDVYNQMRISEGRQALGLSVFAGLATVGAIGVGLTGPGAPIAYTLGAVAVGSAVLAFDRFYGGLSRDGGYWLTRNRCIDEPDARVLFGTANFGLAEKRARTSYERPGQGPGCQPGPPEISSNEMLKIYASNRSQILQWSHFKR